MWEMNIFEIEKFDALAEYFDQQTDCSRYRRKISQSKEKSSEEELVKFTFPYQTNGKHARAPSTVSHIISEQHSKSTFNFTKIVAYTLLL